MGKTAFGNLLQKIVEKHNQKLFTISFEEIQKSQTEVYGKKFSELTEEQVKEKTENFCEKLFQEEMNYYIRKAKTGDFKTLVMYLDKTINPN